ASPVRTQKTEDLTTPDLEGEAADCNLVAEHLPQPVGGNSEVLRVPGLDWEPPFGGRSCVAGG
ncbi:MAG: hypothetical protein JO270_09160, partial [Acidobacteriaceae bacterium]|nr:hypothetical protein [Acidobacteriaceae bacterium]